MPPRDTTPQDAATYILGILTGWSLASLIIALVVAIGRDRIISEGWMWFLLAGIVLGGFLFLILTLNRVVADERATGIATTWGRRRIGSI